MNLCELTVFGDCMSFLSYRSLPEPLMTYELHGEFIVPASKYLTRVQIERCFFCLLFFMIALLWFRNRCCKCSFRDKCLFQLSKKEIGIKDNWDFFYMEVRLLYEIIYKYTIGAIIWFNTWSNFFKSTEILNAQHIDNFSWTKLALT